MFFVMRFVLVYVIEIVTGSVTKTRKLFVFSNLKFKIKEPSSLVYSFSYINRLLSSHIMGWDHFSINIPALAQQRIKNIKFT